LFEELEKEAAVLGDIDFDAPSSTEAEILAAIKLRPRLNQLDCQPAGGGATASASAESQQSSRDAATLEKKELSLDEFKSLSQEDMIKMLNEGLVGREVYDEFMRLG
jgi:hypothetical protein